MSTPPKTTISMVDHTKPRLLSEDVVNNPIVFHTIRNKLPSGKDKLPLSHVNRATLGLSQSLPPLNIPEQACGIKYDHYIKDNNLTEVFYNSITRSPHIVMSIYKIAQRLHLEYVINDFTYIDEGGSGAYWDITLNIEHSVIVGHGVDPQTLYNNTFGCDLDTYSTFLRSVTYQERMKTIVLSVLKFFTDNATEYFTLIETKPSHKTYKSLHLIDFFIINIMAYAKINCRFDALHQVRHGFTRNDSKLTLLFDVWHDIYRIVLKEYKILNPTYIPNLKKSGMDGMVLERLYEDMRTQEDIERLWNLFV